MSVIDLLNRPSEYLVYELLNMEERARMTEALLYFIPGFIMLSILLTVVVYLITTITGYLSFDKIRIYLERHKKNGLGNLMAAGFGAITPFCSCSSVPLKNQAKIK